MRLAVPGLGIAAFGSPKDLKGTAVPRVASVLRVRCSSDVLGSRRPLLVKTALAPGAGSRSREGRPLPALCYRGKSVGAVEHRGGGAVPPHCEVERGVGRGQPVRLGELVIGAMLLDGKR